MPTKQEEEEVGNHLSHVESKPQDTYLVSTCIGTNEVILGSYKTMDEAKSSIDSHSRLMKSDSSVKLNIYRVPLQSFLLHTFTKDEMQDAMENNLQQDYELEIRANRAKEEPLETKLKSTVERQNAQNTQNTSQSVQFLPQTTTIPSSDSRALIVRDSTDFSNNPITTSSTLPRITSGNSGISSSVLQRHMQRLQNRRR